MLTTEYQAIATDAVDIRLARFACGRHLGRVAESPRRLVAPRSVSEMGVLRGRDQNFALNNSKDTPGRHFLSPAPSSNGNKVGISIGTLTRSPPSR